MSEEMRSDRWPEQFERISKSTGAAISLLHGLAKHLLGGVEPDDDIPDSEMPNDLSHILRNLDQELMNIEKINRDLRDYFCSLPVRKLLTGLPLTREQFYLLAATGAITIPSGSGEDPYKEFMYYLYEDNDTCGYINLAETPLEQRINMEDDGWETEPRMSLGVIPEDVNVSCLDVDQREFFKKYRPELYARFDNK
jgi:hypothetical protein